MKITLLPLCASTLLLTSCAANSIGSFGHYSETMRNTPEDIRKSREINAAILNETYRPEEAS